MTIVQIRVIEYDGIALMRQTDVVGNLLAIQEKRGTVHQQVGHQDLGRIVHTWNGTTLDDQQSIGRAKEHAAILSDARGILRESVALRIFRETIGSYYLTIGTDKADTFLQGNPQVTGRQFTHRAHVVDCQSLACVYRLQAHQVIVAVCGFQQSLAQDTYPDVPFWRNMYKVHLVSTQ